MCKQKYADRKLEFQEKVVKKLSNKKDARYYEQYKVLQELKTNPNYLYGDTFEVTADTWTNKYHNFLSQVVKLPFYEDELESLDDL